MSELGSLLVRAREARGLTLEDAERDTRISRRYLQALEAEQFEVIPAPVYARGFLRSYSQYLGLDPQETLGLFPREDDAEYGEPKSPTTTSAPARATRQQPISAVGASRPTWRQPQQGEAPRTPGGRKLDPTPPRRRGQPAAERPRRAPQRDGELPLEPLEPMIGVDIGVARPNTRIKTDPAAQTRSAVIGIVAVAAVIAVVLLAFLISNLGGSGAPGTATNSPSAKSTTRPSTTGLPTTAGGLPPSGLTVTPGIVPSLIGQSSTVAKSAIQEAGYVAVEKTQKSSEVKGKVIDQSPGAEATWPAGSAVTIVVSEGP
ncbi:MAG: helix-turn-helix domain-containing protein [Anaerolineaceae bacterium]